MDKLNTCIHAYVYGGWMEGSIGNESEGEGERGAGRE